MDVDSPHHKGVWIKNGSLYAITAWKKIPNVHGSYVLHDIMGWRGTYLAAVQWRSGTGMLRLASGETGNAIVTLNEKAGRLVLIRRAPFFSLLGHIEWRGVDVNKQVP